MSLIEIPEFNWSGTYKKIELGAKQIHIIKALFELAEVMGGVSFASAAYRVLQLAPQVLEEERRVNALPAQIYRSSPSPPIPQPIYEEVELPRLSPPEPPPKSSQSFCAADLI